MARLYPRAKFCKPKDPLQPPEEYPTKNRKHQRWLQLYFLGYSSAEIGNAYGISRKTVEYVQRKYKKWILKQYDKAIEQAISDIAKGRISPGKRPTLPKIL